MRRILRYLPFILVCAIVAGAATYIVAHRRVTYTASSTIAVSPTSASAELIQGSTGTSATASATYVATQEPFVTSAAVLRIANAEVLKQTGHRLAHISVTGDEAALTLTASAKSRNRTVAAASANAVLRAYGQNGAAQRRRLLRSAISGLGRQLVQLRAQITRAETAIANLPTSSGTTTTAAAGATSAQTQLSTLTAAYEQAYAQHQNLVAESRVAEGGYANISSASPRTARPSATGKLALLGALLGAILGGLIALLREQIVGTIRSGVDVSKSVHFDILAQLPRAPRSARRLGGRAYAAHRDLGEALRRLRVNLRLQTIEPPQAIAVMSPDRREGRSFVAANLATSWALSGRRVLLIASDLRHDGLGGMVHADDDQTGLTDLLIDAQARESQEATDEAVLAAARPTEIANLSFLSAGTVTDHPENLLELDELDEVVEALRRHWDILVFDSGPLLTSGEGTILARHADAVLLLATVDTTRKSHLRSAYDALLVNGVATIFMVVNKDSSQVAPFTDLDGQRPPDRSNLSSSSPRA